MTRIMERFDYEFGYFKAYFFVVGLVALGFLIYGITTLGGISEAEFEVYLGLGIACVIMIIIAAIIYGVTLKNLPGENPILLALGMIAVGLFAGVFIAFIVVGTIVSIFTGDNDSSSSEGENKGVFAQKYIRDSDGEYFTLYSQCSDNIAVLASESRHATTVEVFNNGIGAVYIEDSEGNHYRPL